MKNFFEETYQQYTELKKQYDAATDEEGKAAARASYQELMQGIEDRGGVACRLWREYEISRENENSILDIQDVVWDKDVESLIDGMREFGIDRFTFSSGWSSAVETAWLFKQNGCELEGLVEVNGNMNFFEGKHETRHGYLFRVN